MVEEFDVGLKKVLNILHGIAALVFWSVVGYYLNKLPLFFLKIPSQWTLPLGIVVGLVRFFIIRDKYSWQIATLNEINRIKTMLRNVNNTPATYNTNPLANEENPN